MKIIIPMSGVGARFAAAGYKALKPLIDVDGMPIIEHVVNLFPGETDIVFICNKEHLATTNMRDILLAICPTAQIVGIDPHKKGPVYAVSKVLDLIDDQEEVIVNYCDFSTYWDYKDFLAVVRNAGADGSIPSYRGFHPHMLHSPNYAFIKEENKWLEVIKEKEPFTTNRMAEYASNGTYYFKKGAYIKKYFPELMALDHHINGEYYVSLVYNLLKRDGLKTLVYEVQHMLQWGTPQDLEEYEQWSAYFAAVMNQKAATVTQNTINLIPMAGRGQRFADAGYTLPKPLIPVSGKPMIVQATESLASAGEHRFICLKDHIIANPAIEQTLTSSFTNAKIVTLDAVTEGQACSAMHGITEADMQRPLLIGACDNGMLWNSQKYQALINDHSIDAIVWTFKNHPASKRNPSMYGWVCTEDGMRVTDVSVKKQISSDPGNDHAIVGTFYFATAKIFETAVQYLYDDNIRVNNEFYIDSCIGVLAQRGYNVRIFEVEHYVCWGTPQDYQTFEYWQSFFHKCDWHPYSLDQDPTVPLHAVSHLEARYQERVASLPATEVAGIELQRSTL